MTFSVNEHHDIPRFLGTTIPPRSKLSGLGPSDWAVDHAVYIILLGLECRFLRIGMPCTLPRGQICRNHALLDTTMHDLCRIMADASKMTERVPATDVIAGNFNV